MITQKQLNDVIQKMEWEPDAKRGATCSVFFSTKREHIGAWIGKWVIKLPHVTEDENCLMLSSAARGAQLLRSMDAHDSRYKNVFHVDGYRLKLVVDQSIPLHESMKPRVVYLYETALHLEAAMLDAQGALQRVSLFDMPNYHAIEESFHTERNHTAKNKYPKYTKFFLMPQYEMAIFQFLNLPREALMVPYAGRTVVSDRRLIAASILDVYKKTKGIVFDGCQKGGFIDCGDNNHHHIILASTSLVYDRNVAESVVFFNRPEVRQIYEAMWQGWDPVQNHADVKEDPASAMIRTLVYVDAQVEHIRFQYEDDVFVHQLEKNDDLVNQYLSPAMIPILHLFRRKQWSLDASTLDTLLIIVERCKILHRLTPDIDLVFVKQVQQMICHDVDALDTFLHVHTKSLNMSSNQAISGPNALSNELLKDGDNQSSRISSDAVRAVVLNGIFVDRKRKVSNHKSHENIATTKKQRTSQSSVTNLHVSSPFVEHEEHARKPENIDEAFLLDFDEDFLNMSMP